MVVTTALALGVLGYLSFGTQLFSNNQVPVESSARPSTTPPSTSPRQSQIVSHPPLSTANGSVTKEGVEVVLSLIDHAVQKKDADAILRHIAPNATFTIHMQRGTNRPSTSMNRDDYRKTLQMGFAFPGTYEYRRVETVVEAAPDGQSAKATFRSVETLRQGGQEARIESVEVATFRAQGQEPVIVAIEQTVLGTPN
jgi:ketosteroid isomerase-like protein